MFVIVVNRKMFIFGFPILKSLILVHFFEISHMSDILRDYIWPIERIHVAYFMK